MQKRHAATLAQFLAVRETAAELSNALTPVLLDNPHDPEVRRCARLAHDLAAKIGRLSLTLEDGDTSTPDHAFHHLDEADSATVCTSPSAQ